MEHRASEICVVDTSPDDGEGHGHGHEDEKAGPSMHHFRSRSSDIPQTCSDHGKLGNTGILDASMPGQGGSSRNNKWSRKRAVVGGKLQDSNQSTKSGTDSEVDLNVAQGSLRGRETSVDCAGGAADIMTLRERMRMETSEDSASGDASREDSRMDAGNFIPRHRKPSRRMQEAVNDHEVSSCAMTCADNTGQSKQMYEFCICKVYSPMYACMSECVHVHTLCTLHLPKKYHSTLRWRSRMADVAWPMSHGQCRMANVAWPMYADYAMIACHKDKMIRTRDYETVR
jgi:hypothetical protein